MYTLFISIQAKKDIAFLKKNGGLTIINRIEYLLQELVKHPKKGIGKPEKLRGDKAGYWSRRIDKKNRLIYSIDDKKVIVEVISAKGHYDDH